MSDRWIAEWQGYNRPRVSREFTTSEEGQHLFAHVDAADDGPVLIDFYRQSDRGGSLTVGAGGVQSVLNYQESIDPPYYSSRGDSDADEPSEAFAYGGHESEFRARNLIDKTAAVLALQEYLQTGRRPGLVRWEEV